MASSVSRGCGSKSSRHRRSGLKRQVLPCSSGGRGPSEFQGADAKSLVTSRCGRAGSWGPRGGPTPFPAPGDDLPPPPHPRSAEGVTSPQPQCGPRPLCSFRSHGVDLIPLPTPEDAPERVPAWLWDPQDLPLRVPSGPTSHFCWCFCCPGPSQQLTEPRRGPSLTRSDQAAASSYPQPLLPACSLLHLTLRSPHESQVPPSEELTLAVGTVYVGPWSPLSCRSGRWGSVGHSSHSVCAPCRNCSVVAVRPPAGNKPLDLAWRPATW